MDIEINKINSGKIFRLVPVHITLHMLMFSTIILKIVFFHDFPPQSCLFRLARTARVALIGKSWKETIFIILAGRINVFLFEKYIFLTLKNKFKKGFLLGSRFNTIHGFNVPSFILTSEWFPKIFNLSSNWINSLFRCQNSSGILI